MNLLEVSHLRKTFGHFVAVEDVSFTVAAGEVFGLLGPNGAGKSTTMNMIVGTAGAQRGQRSCSTARSSIPKIASCGWPWASSRRIWPFTPT